MKFRRQHPIGPFVVDFCCPSAALIIELDGGQHDASRASDASRTQYLNDLGYTVIRFWNLEFLKNEEGVLAEIAAAVDVDR